MNPFERLSVAEPGYAAPPCAAAMNSSALLPSSMRAASERARAATEFERRYSRSSAASSSSSDPADILTPAPFRDRPGMKVASLNGRLFGSNCWRARGNGVPYSKITRPDAGDAHSLDSRIFRRTVTLEPC